MRKNVSRIRAPRSRWASASGRLPMKKSARSSDFSTEEVRLLVAALRSRRDDARVDVVDAAYWMKGCSSLGRLRFAILLRKKPSKRRRPLQIDIKEAVVLQAAAPRHPQHQPKTICLDPIRCGHYSQTRTLPCTIRLIRCTSGGLHGESGPAGREAGMPQWAASII